MNAATRRQLLRAASLVAAAAARSPRVRAETLTETRRRASFIYIHTPNGFRRAAFGADGVGDTLSLRPSLTPLEPWKAELAVVSGLCNKSANEVTGARDICRLLTCASGPRPEMAYGSSIDHVVAAAMGPRPLNLTVHWPQPSDWRVQLSWWSKESPVPPINDLAAVWDDVFGEVRRIVRSRRVLEQLEVEAHRAFPLPAREAARMKQHGNALRTMKDRLPNGDRCRDPSPLRAQLTNLPGELTPSSLAAHYKAKVDAIVAAIACGTRRAITLQWQGAGAGIDPTGTRKTHVEVTRSNDTASLAAREAIDRWYAGQLAYLLGELQTRNLLSTTLVVWGSEVSEGDNQNGMTFVLAGGSALGLRTRTVLTFPVVGDERQGRATARRPENRAVADLWATVAQICGASQTSFGDLQDCGGVLPGLIASS